MILTPHCTALLSYYIDTLNITKRYATLAEDVDRLMEGVFRIAEEDGEDLDCSDPQPLDDASSSEDESPVSDDELDSSND